MRAPAVGVLLTYIPARVSNSCWCLCVEKGECVGLQWNTTCCSWYTDLAETVCMCRTGMHPSLFAASK